MTFARGREAQARKAAKAARAKNTVPKRLGIRAEPVGPIRDRQHMARVAACLCLVCGLAYPQCHHPREALPRTMGVRVGDDTCVPLCPTHHAELHMTNNMAFWQRYKIDPLKWARNFYAETLRLREKI